MTANKRGRRPNPSNIRNVFAERLRGLMDSENLNRSGLAKATGVSHASIGAYLAGRLPGYDVLISLADEFNCSIDYLLGRTLNKSTCEYFTVEFPDFAEGFKREIKDAIDNVLDNSLDIIELGGMTLNQWRESINDYEKCVDECYTMGYEDGVLARERRKNNG